MPNAERGKREIGNPGTIGVTAQGEQRRLPFVGGKQTPGDYETTGSGPTLRPKLEFRHLPIAVDGAVAQSGQGTFQRWGHTSDNGIFGAVRFEGVEDGIEPKTCIGAYAHFADIGRDIAKAGGEQFGFAIPGSGVATTELGVPEVGRVGFHAQQWVIRTFSAIARIVANLGPVLMAEDGHDRAVEIKDEPGTVIGQMNESLQQSIVYAMQLFPEPLWGVE